MITTLCLVAVGALLVIGGLADLLILCVTVLTSSVTPLASAMRHQVRNMASPSEAVTSEVVILRLGQCFE